MLFLRFAVDSLPIRNPREKLYPSQKILVSNPSFKKK
jgi:hypothetical protein